MATVTHWIATYGYGVIFLLLMLGVVGLPIPDETILVYCGYLIFKGNMKPVQAWLCALGGSWCGISLSYTIGRTLGLGFVHKFGKYFHITDARLEQVHKWFDRIGHWALMVGYFIAGARHFTAIVAGTSKLRFVSFMAYAWTGGLLWVTTFLTLGYFLGENWERIFETIHHGLLYGSIGAIAVFACYYLVISIQKRRKRDGTKGITN
jgi:membrane protein DedA with SNARE-associated domain